MSRLLSVFGKQSAFSGSEAGEVMIRAILLAGLGLAFAAPRSEEQTQTMTVGGAHL